MAKTKKNKAKRGQVRASRSGQRGARDASNRSITRGPAVPRQDFLKNHVAGLEQSIRRTLVWVATFNSTTVISTYTEAAVIILNNPLLPCTAVANTPAIGYVKYMAFYSKCFTIAARVKIKGVLSGAFASGPPPSASHIGLTITTNSTSLGSVVAAVGEGLVDYDVVNVNPDHYKREMSIDIGKFLDKPDVLDDPQLFGTSAASPTQVVDAHLWHQDLSGTNVSSLGGIIEVEFDCIFTDPIPFT